MPLLNREAELAALDGLVADVREGRSGSVVLRGEAGVGMTSLLDHVIDSAQGIHVARIVGVQSEAPLPFAAIQQLCAPRQDRFGDLPDAQYDALAAVFGLIRSVPPGVYMVGLAALTLLSEWATERPLLVIVDDSQWVDPVSLVVLAFVARRLVAENIAMIFTVRDPTIEHVPLDGLAEIRVDGLTPHDSRVLLSSVVTGLLASNVRDRIVSESDGNPLALVEISSQLTSDQLAGESVLPDRLPLSERLEESFLGRVRAQPEDTQLLLLLAAAEPDGSADLLWRAARWLGISSDASGPAETDGLLRVGTEVSFRHPLVRSAVYSSAPIADRQRVHRALADAVDADRQPDRSAWHRGAAAVGPDEDVASSLARSAERASARGDARTAGVLLVRAAQLSPADDARADRLLAAAHAELAAGAPGRANGLLAESLAARTGDLQMAQALRLRGSIAVSLGHGADGCAILLAAAHALEHLDVGQSRAAHLEALEAAIYAGRLGSSGSLLDAAVGAANAPVAPDGEKASADHLLDGFASLLTVGHRAAVTELRRAVRGLEVTDAVRWLPLGVFAAMEIFDDDGVHGLAARHVDALRAAGSLAQLPRALDLLAGTHLVLDGQLAAAVGTFAEARDITKAARDAMDPGGTTPGELIVSAWSGSEDTRELAADCTRDAIAGGIGRYVTFALYATSVLENGLGHYDAALTAAREACDDVAVYVVTTALPEFVEAAERAGEHEIAVSAEHRFAERADACDTDWALGMRARCRALVTKERDAEALYREAIGRLNLCRAAPHLARAHLLYGEWLRRRRRRRDARQELRTAHQMLSSMGIRAFAERARIELTAAGEKQERSETDAPMTELLTPQESQIAQLVSHGASNPEVAAQLFISRRTVEFHLSKVYMKLGVSSRTQLARLFIEEQS